MASDRGGRFRLWAVAVWMAVWQLGSMALDQPLLLPSPLTVARCLAALAGTGAFWSAVGGSAVRILGGFLLACVAGIACGALTARYRHFGELLSPLLASIKAVPVMSFIILAYLWLPDKSLLPLLIAFLMVFPVICGNVLTGVRETDPQLLEMARVFRVPLSRRLTGIYLPQVLPYFRTAASLGLGLCWKSGVAAEVIGLTAGSLGERLYQSKIYFEVPELFAWTVTIVAVSVGFEKLFLRLLDAFAERMGG